MKILVLTNLYPPHHAGTHDFRCQTVTDALRLRGNATLILTSNHGISTEQRDPEIERRLWLNGHFGHRIISGYRALLALEKHNHAALNETLSEFQPDLVQVGSLRGLSKSLIAGLRAARVPTVYDIADEWLADELSVDPWLRWWNEPGANLTRAGLEMSGQRGRLETTAPTRLAPGFDRLPEIFGKPKKGAVIEPNSIMSLRLERPYFCHETLKRRTEQAGYRVEHAEVVYPGVATQQFYGEVKPASRPLKKLLVVSRLDAASGVMTALEAVRSLRQGGLSLVLNVVGRGDSDYVSKVRSFAVQNSIPVEFPPVSNVNQELPGIYRQHDALLYTAEADEPFTTVPLQAMACGVPVIASRSGGVREILRHGENALTFAAGDSMELAARIQEMYSQPALREQMATTAQTEVVSRFNETAMIDRIEDYLATSLEIWQHA